MSSIRQTWVRVVLAAALGGLLLGSAVVRAAPEDEERQHRWQSLSPEKREELMQRYERFRQLPPEEQEAVKRRYHKWREMPEEERRAMRDKWSRMTPDERRALRDRRDDDGSDGQYDSGGGQKDWKDGSGKDKDKDKRKDKDRGKNRDRVGED